MVVGVGVHGGWCSVVVGRWGWCWLGSSGWRWVGGWEVGDGGVDFRVNIPFLFLTS